jgi:AcrR family transcriptional regulator
MAPEYAGRGDPARSMDLLWGRAPRGSRGPKPGTDLEAIVHAAIEIADREGLEAVSMRRLAEEVGLGTMSLYTYVPGKGELLDLMLDTVHGEAVDASPPEGASLRHRLEALARSQWAFHERHPWTLSIASGRSVLGPNELDSYQSALSVVADLGLAARDAVAMVDAISLYVRGAARDAAEAAAAERVTGVTEQDWWAPRDAILAEMWSSDRFAILDRLARGGGFAVPDDSENYNVRFIVDDFEFGLQRLLDGMEAFAGDPGDERVDANDDAPR